MVIVVDKGRNLSLEIAGQELVFQQDAVFEGLAPALDLALGHWMIGCAAQVLDVAGTEPFGQIAGDVAGTVVGQEPWALHGFGLVQPTGLQRQVECGVTSSAFIVVHSFQATI